MKLFDILNVSEFEDCDYECKANLEEVEDKLEKWAKSISAFSNSGEGHMFVGVSDDLEAFGLDHKSVDRSKNLVLKTIDRHIFPHVKVHFATIPVGEGKYVLDILVPSFPEVVCLRIGDYNEKVYVRENGASVPATVAQIIALGKRKFGVDVRTTGASYSKKDFSHYLALAHRFRKDGSEPNENELITLEALSNDGRVKEGLAMFADNYDSEDSLLVCRLWDGLDKGSDQVLDKKVAKGPLGDTFLEAMNFIARNTKKGFLKIADGSRLDTRSYPELALREVLVNAIAHRDYSIENTQVDVDIFKDRIEISSPGSWLLASSPEKYQLMKIPSIRRNRIICASFEGAGLMEQSASGFKKVAKIYEPFPDKAPFLENGPDCFVVTLYDLFYGADSVQTQSNKYDGDILSFCTGEARSREEIQKHLGIQSRSYLMSHYIRPLLESGKLKATAPTRSPHIKYIAS
jgi:ATP-dependent DNA helicase RecG